jgi:hypothetical protein
MNNNTGKTFSFQTQIAPSQPVAKPLGNLAFQPGNIRKFMEDHQVKVQQIRTLYCSFSNTLATTFFCNAYGLRVPQLAHPLRQIGNEP